MTYTKMKKSDLIKIINQYEQTLEELQNLDLHTPPSNNHKVFLVVDKEEDNKNILYLKNRLKCVKNTKLQIIYESELNRLLKLFN